MQIIVCFMLSIREESCREDDKKAWQLVLAKLRRQSLNAVGDEELRVGRALGTIERKSVVTSKQAKKAAKRQRKELRAIVAAVQAAPPAAGNAQAGFANICKWLLIGSHTCGNCS